VLPSLHWGRWRGNRNHQGAGGRVCLSQARRDGSFLSQLTRNVTEETVANLFNISSQFDPFVRFLYVTMWEQQGQLTELNPRGYSKQRARNHTCNTVFVHSASDKRKYSNAGPPLSLGVSSLSLPELAMLLPDVETRRVT
jgi:hypothetical protein